MVARTRLSMTLHVRCLSCGEFCITYRWPVSAETCCKQIYHIHSKLFVIDGGFPILFLIMDKDRVPCEVRTESLETIKRVEMSTILIFIYFFVLLILITSLPGVEKNVPLSHLLETLYEFLYFP
jgi:hypothetical protein